jgi:hypothetical protein
MRNIERKRLGSLVIYNSHWDICKLATSWRNPPPFSQRAVLLDSCVCNGTHFSNGTAVTFIYHEHSLCWNKLSVSTDTSALAINSQYNYSSIELRPWRYNSHWTSQEIHLILCNMTIRYPILRIPQILPDLRQISPIHAAQFPFL